MRSEAERGSGILTKSPVEEKALGNLALAKRQWVQRHAALAPWGEVPMRSEAERGSVSPSSQFLPRDRCFNQPLTPYTYVGAASRCLPRIRNFRTSLPLSTAVGPASRWQHHTGEEVAFLPPTHPAGVATLSPGAHHRVPAISSGLKSDCDWAPSSTYASPCFYS